MATLHPWSPVSVNPEVTGALMEARHHALVTGRMVDDGLLAASLIRVGAVSQALVAVGVDVAVAADRLAALPGTPWYRLRWRTFLTDSPLHRAATRAHASGLAELTGPFAFALLAESPDVAGALGQASFSLLKFRGYVAHGAAVDPPFPPEGPVRVVLHNDPFTTMELVVEALRTDFGRDEETAAVLMMRVHTKGSASLATMDAAEARRALELLRARADAAQMPLRVSVLPAG